MEIIVGFIAMFVLAFWLIVFGIIVFGDDDTSEKKEEKKYACRECGQVLEIETNEDDENLILVSGCSTCEERIRTELENDLTPEILTDVKDEIIRRIQDISQYDI